jgi:hypothetical protein
MVDSGVTFVIHIRHYDNDLWQGEIQHLGMKKSQRFRTTWELLHLIRLGLATEQRTRFEHRSWDSTRETCKG